MATTETSDSKTSTVKLKLMIDKRANKVLFAEAGKDFVDILFNLLYLPFATVARLIGNVGKVSCAGNLYQSLENLNESYLQPNQNKVELLKPISNEYVLLQPLACPQPSVQRKLYNCRSKHQVVTDQKNKFCPLCVHQLMDQEVKQFKTIQGGIVKKMVTYMVKDDLSVTPGSMISGISMLQANGEDIDYVENRTVEIGRDEVLELLKASLLSKAALTTVFLKEEAMTNKNNLCGV